MISGRRPPCPEERGGLTPLTGEQEEPLAVSGLVRVRLQFSLAFLQAVSFFVLEKDTGATVVLETVETTVSMVKKNLQPIPCQAPG